MLVIKQTLVSFYSFHAELPTKCQQKKGFLVSLAYIKESNGGSKGGAYSRGGGEGGRWFDTFGLGDGRFFVGGRLFEEIRYSTTSIPHSCVSIKLNQG